MKSFHFPPLIPEVNYTTRIEELPAAEIHMSVSHSLPWNCDSNILAHTHIRKRRKYHIILSLSLSHTHTHTTYEIPVARIVSLPTRQQTPPSHSQLFSHFDLFIYYSLFKTLNIISSTWSKGELNYSLSLSLSIHLRFHTKY